MNKICTSLKQSKKLIELGINISTADMHYVLIDSDKEIYDIGFGDYIGILPHYPAWSLSALLELIHNKAYILRNSNVGTNRYNVWIAVRKSPVLCETPLDAAFEMICWLKENRKL